MAQIDQTWAQDAESGAGEPGHPTNGDSNSAPYADTDRFGKPLTGATAPIFAAQNLVSDPVWGVQAPVGGVPAAPEIPVTKGE